MTKTTKLTAQMQARKDLGKVLKRLMRCCEYLNVHGVRRVALEIGDEVDVSVQQVYSWFRGEYLPSADKYMALAELADKLEKEIEVIQAS